MLFVLRFMGFQHFNGGANMVEDYGCDICGARKDYDEEIIWITSTYGVCEDCFNKLTNDDLDKIRNDFE